MEKDMEDKVIDNWNDLFSHISYAYEREYCKEMEIYTCPHTGTKSLTIYKLTIMDDGTLNYKGSVDLYDTKLWPLVVMFSKLWNNKTIEILYG